MSEMKFFKFRQNNSGGYFDGYHNVLIEARNAIEANELAQASGLVYFEDRGDCVECCGYRWSEFWASDITVDGYTIFSRELIEEGEHIRLQGYFSGAGDSVIVYYDGTTEEF